MKMLPILILFFLVLFVTPEMVPASTSCHRAMSAKSPNSSASKYLLRGRENSKSWLKWLRSGQNESSITSNDVHFLQTLKLDLILKVRNFKNPPLARVLRNLVMFKKKSPFMTNVENQNKVIVLAEELIEMIDNIKKSDFESSLTILMGHAIVSTLLQDQNSVTLKSDRESLLLGCLNNSNEYRVLDCLKLDLYVGLNNLSKDLLFPFPTLEMPNIETSNHLLSLSALPISTSRKSMGVFDGFEDHTLAGVIHDKDHYTILYHNLSLFWRFLIVENPTEYSHLVDDLQNSLIEKSAQEFPGWYRRMHEKISAARKNKANTSQYTPFVESYQSFTQTLLSRFDDFNGELKEDLHYLFFVLTHEHGYPPFWVVFKTITSTDITVAGNEKYGYTSAAVEIVELISRVDFYKQLGSESFEKLSKSQKIQRLNNAMEVLRDLIEDIPEKSNSY